MNEPDRLSPAATAALDEADETDGVGLSIASLLDIWFATQKGGPTRIEIDKYEQLKAFLGDPDVNVHTLPITERAAPHLDNFTRTALPDPFDRFIVATALEHELPLVTADKRIIDLGAVPTIW